MLRTILIALIGALTYAQIPAVQGTITDAFTLRFIDVAAGTGAPAEAGKVYVVHYTGYLTDGTKFDSSLDRKEPLRFRQGKRQVIAGWDAGFAGMRAGGKRRLMIPYQLAYGDKGIGSIPGKADLVFDVELLDVQDGPAMPPNADVLLPLKNAEEEVIALAKAVPEEKYSWRPQPGVRSFGEVFLHIAAANELQLGLLSEPSKEELEKMIAKTEDAQKQPLTKQQIVERLEQSFAKVRDDMEKARGLDRDARFFGQATTRRGIYVFIDAHVSEHLGQLIAYSRMNGIVPPWSK
jgi:uncharacterized damage-inducible protein DinB